MKKITDFFRSELGKIIPGAVLLASAIILDLLAPSAVSITVYILALCVTGYGVFISAIRGILGGDFLDEKFLMSIASIGAMIIGEYSEGVFVMLFFLVGEYFEHRAVNKSRNTIRALMDICPDTATVIRDGAELRLDADEVEIGDILLIRPGERVAVDCEIAFGSADIDTSALTGESIPVSASVGDRIISGSVVLGGLIRARAVATADESGASRILSLVEDATERKSKEENFITSFSRVYTPIVVGLALLLAVIPPLFDLMLWQDSIYRALSFLVISCPCALVISVPMAFFAGIGVSASHGILFKGSSSFSPISRVRTVAFDKTGTITTGTLSVSEINPVDGISEEELLSLVASAEYASTHPIAAAIKKAFPKPIPPEESWVSAGKGSGCLIGGRRVLVGNLTLMREASVAPPPPSADGAIYVSCDGKYIGNIVLTDSLKPEVKDALAALRKLGISRTIILSGDRASSVKQTAEAVGIYDYRAELLPEDKFAALEELISDGKDKLMYVGDGINDAPSLAYADVGVAMGDIGTDSAKESADVVITGDSLMRIPEAIKTARRTLRIAKENIFLAIGIKLIVLLLTALGIANMWLAIFADVGVLLLAVLNSMRMLVAPKQK